MSDLKSGLCKICSKETKSKCSNCNQVFYCSAEHQKEDWKSHKQLCHPFKITQNEKLGRHLVTTRKIKPYEVILKESPLTRGPSQVTGPVCLGCLNSIDEQNYVPCQNCGWPLCSKECEENSEHKEECQLTQKRSQKKVTIHEFTTPHPMYQCIAALRALLLKKVDQEKYEKLSRLESHGDIRRGSPQWKSDLESIGKFIPRFFQTDEFTEDEIMNITGIVQINGHEVPTSDPPHVAIFDVASLVEHSCKPNLAKSFTKNGGLMLWAPHSIPKNTNLSICYSDAVWGTGDRQRHLMHTKLFKCECERCKDVTEFGTNYSALKCKKQSCSGYALPSSLENWHENWKCLDCGDVVDKLYVNEILEKAGKDLSTMEKNVPNCLKYIEYYQKWFPRRHFYICEIKIQVLQKIGSDSKDLMVVSDEQLETKLEYAKEMIDLYEILAPCEARILGILCFEAHSAIAEKTRRISLKNNINTRVLLEESLKFVEKAIEYLQHESNIFAEGLIYKQAKINRDALKMITQNEKLGRHLVTTRKIKPYEVILKESPLTRGPSQVTGPVCLGCLNSIDEQNYVPCQNCGWPLCSKECEENSEHKEECQLTQKRSQKKVTIHEFTTPHPMYQCIAALRALLLKKVDQEKYEKLSRLESHGDIRRGSPQWKSDLESIGKFIPRFFQTDEFTEDEIMNITGIVQINGHEVPTSDPPHVAIFDVASLVEHSCKPNLAKSFTKNGGLMLWAPHSIPKNTNLSICYSDAVWGTGDRQRHLMHTKLFKCECERCKDVTEFGTNYSALKCKKQSCSGYALPSSLENWHENWKCLDCGDVVDKLYVNEILEKAGKDLSTMEKNVPNCLKYIEYYQKWFPRRHFYICEIKIQVLQKIGSDSKDLMVVSDEQLETKLEYAKEMIDLYEILAPCEARILGILCFEAHSAIAEKTRRISLKNNINTRVLLEESLKFVEKAIEYLQHESNIFAEGLIYKQAKINRDALKMVMTF